MVKIVLRSALIGAAAIAVVALVGCEKMEAAGRVGDRAVDEAITKSLDSAEGVKGIPDITTASKESSPAGKARAGGELARLEYDSALDKIAQFRRDALVEQQALFDLRQAAREIAAIHDAASSFTARQSDEPIKALDQQRTQMEKSRDEAKSKVAALTQQLDAAKKEIADLENQRKAADAEAGSLADKSKTLKGEESVNVFKQSVQSAIKAGTLGSQIEAKNAALLPVQDQLAAAQALVERWDNANPPGAIQRLEAQKAAIQAGGEVGTTQSKTIGDLAGTRLAEVVTPNNDKKHPNAGAQLKESSATASAALKDAEKLLKNASQHAADAMKAAQGYHKDLSAIVSKNQTSPDAPGLQNLIAAYDENQYALQKGMIDATLANLYQDEALLDQDVANTSDLLTKSTTAAGLSAPELPKADPATASANASKAMADAEKSLESVVGARSNSPGMKEMKEAATEALRIARGATTQPVVAQ